jgi:hypothetical protein
VEDYKNEDWVSLYQSALLELEQVKMSGRIEVAHAAIVARMRKLCTLPGLHPQARQAIEDALRGLSLLRAEEARSDAEQARRVVDRSLENLRSVGPTIQRLRRDADRD